MNARTRTSPNPTLEEFRKVVRSRRSVRRFTDEPLPEQVLIAVVARPDTWRKHSRMALAQWPEEKMPESARKKAFTIASTASTKAGLFTTCKQIGRWPRP